MGDSWRPFGHGGPPPPMPPNVRDSMFSFDGVRRQANPNTRNRFDRDRNPRHRPYGGNPRPFRSMASRPLLSQRDRGDQQVLRDTSVADKFRNLDEITDSEEDAMSESDDDRHQSKKAKIADDRSLEAATPPKWSNPDPYTALPPAAEGVGKRTDVLKLIRKAKIAHEKDQADKPAQDEDFISFDLDEDEDETLSAAPNGPRENRAPNAFNQVDGLAGEHLGKRRRGNDEAMPRPPGGYLPPDQLILSTWIAQGDINPTPWFEPRSSPHELRPSREPAGIALHKEIIDFFDWVKPQEYEREVRADLLKRLSLAFSRIEPGELKSFGSYAAGLYLPVGDMDLVYLTRSYRPGNVMRNGIPPKPPRKLLERFAALLRNSGIAKPTTVLTIPWAKVPIVKFIDARTGLKVDLSFDNDSGLTANETFQSWKVAYPTMPILVSIIKQFLMIRGLNDVASGGLGGFSIICLVTSLVQHMPGLGPTANLGEMLVEFFNLYGNLLDRDSVAIRMDPPGYIDKDAYKPLLFTNEKRGRLTIIDPNRPENNISGGTHLIESICEAFVRAYDVLQDRLGAYETGDTDVSFLADLVGGDFTSYDTQRKQLASIYFGLTGQEPAGQKTSLKTKHVRSSPQVDGATEQRPADEPQAVKKPPKHENRATRLKEARPDIADQVGMTISIKDALRIGGYESGTAMHLDLESTLQNKMKQNQKQKSNKGKGAKKRKSKA